MNTPSLSEKTTSSPPPKLLDQVVAKIRFKHYSRRTEQSYAHWIKRFILFHGKRHPKEMACQRHSFNVQLAFIKMHSPVAAKSTNLPFQVSNWLPQS
jgi:hypothetical protein